MSFRTISIGAGVIALLATMFASAKLFDATRSRVLFLLGMLSGGYMLLFFGYVENYSLLSLSIVIYSCLGMLIAQDKITRWWILVPQAAAVFFHILGVILVPATFFLLSRETKVARRFARIRPVAKWALIVAATAMLLALFLYTRSQYLFFRLAVLPIVTNRFTVAGYTLFSFAHLVDYLNLLFVLVPGIVVVLASLRFRQFAQQWTNPTIRFLALLTACSLGAAFIFDPKLGMPRDWDLFSFAGIGLTALTYYWLLNQGRISLLAPMLTIALGLLVLGPRVVSQILPDIAVAHARNYKDIDQIKNRNLYPYLVHSLREQGKGEEADQLHSEWNRRFPERLQTLQLSNLFEVQRYSDAKTKARHLLQRDPLLPDVWCYLGLAYANLGDVDSAIACYRVSLALNPGDPAPFLGLASARIDQGKLDEAMDLLDRAIAVDSTRSAPFYQKSRVAALRGDRDSYIKNLSLAVSRSDAQPAVMVELLQVEARSGNMPEARTLLSRALAHGLDSTYIDSFATRYPGLWPAR